MIPLNSTITKSSIITRLIQHVLSKKAHYDVIIPHENFRIKVDNQGLTITIDDLIEYGFRQSLGEPQGQIADYRLALQDGKSIHIRVYHDVFKIHWDYVDPRIDPIGHIAIDAPHYLHMLNNILATITNIIKAIGNK